jgi:4-hydroxy-4-methyl-2-oxoglutarate aldolase
VSAIESNAGPALARGHSSATVYEAAEAEHRSRHPTDQLGDCGRFAVDPRIRTVWSGATLAGPAFTVQGAGGDNLALHHAVVAAPAGHVLVADLGDAPFGHWGEVLAAAAQSRGLTGLVIDGGVRDVAEQRAVQFPVFCSHVSVRGTRKLFRGKLDVTVRIGGVNVAPGDLVVADDDGVVIVPHQRVAAVLDHADRRVLAESDIIEALRSGRTTLDLYGLG